MNYAIEPSSLFNPFPPAGEVTREGRWAVQKYFSTLYNDGCITPLLLPLFSQLYPNLTKQAISRQWSVALMEQPPNSTSI